MATHIFILTFVALLSSLVIAYPGSDFDFEHATADQVSRFDSCFFIDAKDVARMPSQAFAGLEPKCAKNLRIDKLTSRQASYLPTDAIRVMDLSVMRSEVFAGFSADQVAAFSADFAKTCSNLGKKSMAAIRAESYAGFTYACVKKWPAEAYRGVPPYGIVSVTSDAARGFGGDIVKLDPDSIHMISRAQVMSFDTSTFGVCYSLDQSFMSNLPGDAYAGFTRGCVKLFNKSAYKGITPEGIIRMLPEVIALFDENAVVIPTETIGVLSADQVRALSPATFSACASLTFFR